MLRSLQCQYCQWVHKVEQSSGIFTIYQICQKLLNCIQKQNQVYPLQYMSQIYSSDYYSNLFSIKEKTILLQKIELLESQIDDLKNRETSLKKINELILGALNSNTSIQQKVLAQIKVLNAGQNKSDLIQKYEQEITQLKDQIIRLKACLSKYTFGSLKQESVKKENSFSFKSGIYQDISQSGDHCLKSEYCTDAKEDNVFLDDYYQNNGDHLKIIEECNERETKQSILMSKSKSKYNSNSLCMSISNSNSYRNKDRDVSYRDSSNILRESLVPSTPGSVINSCNFRKEKHKRRFSQRIYEIEIKQKQNNPTTHSRKSSIEIMKLIKEKQFIDKEIENCQRKCNENIQTQIDSIVCIVKKRNSQTKIKGFFKEKDGGKIQKQPPLERKASQRKGVGLSQWDEKVEKFKTPRYVKKNL